MLTTKQAVLQMQERMLAQNERSTGGSVIWYKLCRYRGDNGNACPVGCITPDHVYDPKMEGLNADKVREDFPAFAEYFEGVNPALMTEAQHMHDYIDVDKWPDVFNALVIKYGA